MQQRTGWLLLGGVIAVLGVLASLEVVGWADPDGRNAPARPVQSTAPAPSATPPAGWQPVDLDVFGLYLPPGWRYEERQGIDSFVGVFLSDDVELWFDYGLYSNSLPEAGAPGYEVTRETIGGKPAKLVKAREAPAEVTGVAFRSLLAAWRTNCSLSWPQHLTVSGRDLTSDQQRTAVAIFRTIRFPGPGEWTVIDAPALPGMRTLALQDVHMVSDNLGWAVGAQQSPDGAVTSALLRFDGSKWHAQSNPATRSLNAIHMGASDEGWAVGTGTAIHYDGTRWTIEPEMPDRLLTDVAVHPDGSGWIASGAALYPVGNGRVGTTTPVEVPATVLDLPSRNQTWSAGDSPDGPVLHRWHYRNGWQAIGWRIGGDAQVLAMDLASTDGSAGWLGGAMANSGQVGGWLQSRCVNEGAAEYYTATVGLPGAALGIERMNDAGTRGWAVGGEVDARNGYVAHLEGDEWTIVARPIDGSIHAIDFVAPEPGFLESPDVGWAVGTRRMDDGQLQGVLLRYEGDRPSVPAAPAGSETPWPETPTATGTPGAPTANPSTSPTPSVDPCEFHPPPTREPLWVDPVTSPTRLLTQTVTVYLGYGREVTVRSVAGSRSVTGTFNAASQPARVTVPLQPGTRHRLEVSGRVEYHPGCFYTLTTDRDRNGDPLIIDQISARPIHLPSLLRSTVP